MTLSSAWISNKKYGWATRPVGELTVILHREHFVLLHGKMETLLHETLEGAMRAADQMYPPDAWSYVGTTAGAGEWSTPGWIVRAGAGGDAWHIYSTSGDLKSKQPFARADLARKWCEVREDRVGINLRGPKPGSKNIAVPE
jgi:hypothetical protein